jgi:hypothetical protein
VLKTVLLLCYTIRVLLACWPVGCSVLVKYVSGLEWGTPLHRVSRQCPALLHQGVQGCCVRACRACRLQRVCRALCVGNHSCTGRSGCCVSSCEAAHVVTVSLSSLVALLCVCCVAWLQLSQVSWLLPEMLLHMVLNACCCLLLPALLPCIACCDMCS